MTHFAINFEQRILATPPGGIEHHQAKLVVSSFESGSAATALFSIKCTIDSDIASLATGQMEWSGHNLFDRDRTGVFIHRALSEDERDRGVAISSNTGGVMVPGEHPWVNCHVVRAYASWKHLTW